MISIIIPVFNNYQTLSSCLAAVQAQSFKNFEIIIVDDGSVAKEKIKTIVDFYNVKKFIRQKNLGAPIARTRGAELSQGEFLLFLDADIVLAKDFLKKTSQQLINSGSDVCYTGFKMGWKKFKTVSFSKEKLSEYNFIHTTSLLKKEIFPGFDQSLQKFQDWDLWLTLAKKNYKFSYLEEILFRIIAPGTMSKWYPQFFYQLPWPLFGYIPKFLQTYQYHQEIIKKKHNL